MTGHHAIHSRAEDTLGRGPFVASLAEAVRNIDDSEGAVIGLIGEWGLGKTSVLNLLEEELKSDPKVMTVTFEPWLFSGTGELTSQFFTELSAQLRGKLHRLNADALLDLLDTYGLSLRMLKWIPVAGPWIGRADTTVKFFSKAVAKKLAKAPSLTAQRSDLIKKLRARDERIVVIIDDLDRLLPQEVRDIFQLVRLTGQFPHLVYVLAFDRERVERVLSDSGFEGQAYLEKIIEFGYNVPPVSSSALDTVFTGELTKLLDRFSAMPLSQERWPDVLFRLRPLFKDLRDVHRYMAALPAALTAIGAEVELVDVLSLEALRVLRPKVYTALAARSRVLTAVEPGRDQEGLRADLDAILQAAPTDDSITRTAVERLLRLLFPATEQYFGNGMHYDTTWAARWRKERRVANVHVLTFYLEKVLSPGTAPVSLMEQVVASLQDERTLRGLLGTLDDPTLQNVIERLGAYEDAFSPAAVEPTLNVLLGLYQRAQFWRGAFGIDGTHSINAVALRLAGTETDPDVLLSIIERTLDRQTSLYSRLRLLRLVPRISDTAGMKIIRPADTAKLFARLWPLVRSATARQLVSEPHLLTLLYNAVLDNRDDRRTIDEQLAEPEVMAAVLRDALNTSTSWNIGSIAARRETNLEWDGLVTVCGGTDKLTALVHSFHAKADPDVLNDPTIRQVLGLLEHHLTAGPPPLRWAKPVPPPQFASSRTRDMLRPQAESAPWLILRTTTLYAASPQKVQESSLLNGEFHRRLCGHITNGEMADAVHAYCEHHGLTIEENQAAELEDQDVSTQLAVVRRAVTGAEPPGTITLRAAVASPGPGTEHVRVITEIWLRGTGGADPAKDPSSATARILSIAEVRDLLTAALGTAAEIGRSLLPDVYDDNAVPHASTEVYVTCGSLSATPPSPDLPELIDLTPLGRSVWNSPPRDGDYATSSPITARDDRRDLVHEALRYIAGGIWRFPDADTNLLTLLYRPEAMEPDR